MSSTLLHKIPKTIYFNNLLPTPQAPLKFEVEKEDISYLRPDYPQNKTKNQKSVTVLQDGIK